MTREKKEIYVYANWDGLETPSLMGILFVESLRGKEVFSFEYSSRWLTSGNTHVLDPDLGFHTGIGTSKS